MSLPDKGAVKRKLPIGIQTFWLIREEGCYYVDKTAQIRRLVVLVDEYDKPMLDALEAPEGAALAQARTRGYADKYRRLKAPIHLIGVEFSQAERNIDAFEVERAA